MLITGLRTLFLCGALVLVCPATGVVGDLNTYYVGAASGGVWKSTDKGARWAPVFDAMPVQAIGALAVSRSDPQQVWAGTGEAWAIRDSDMMGDGIYKSTDAGATWQHMGLDRDRPHRPHHGASHRPEYRLRVRPGPHHRPAAGARRLQNYRRRHAPGTACCLWIRTPAAPASTSTLATPTPCSPACGKWRCTPTPCSAADPPAVSMSPTMAARIGAIWKVTACRIRRWARSMSHPRLRIPSESMR